MNNLVPQVRRFQLGNIVVENRSLDSLSYGEVLELLHRHQSGDWGDISEERKEENETALQEHAQVCSVYVIDDEDRKVIIRTNLAKNHTTTMKMV